MITEPNTGFSFYATTDTSTTGGFTWGYALPPGSMTTAATEYLGYVVSGAAKVDNFAIAQSGIGCPN